MTLLVLKTKHILFVLLALVMIFFYFNISEAQLQVQTYQTGTMLYLDNGTTKIGLESQWGGSIAEINVNGVNYVDRYDTGREVQLSLYDGNPLLGCTSNCLSTYGWNPVQGGDQYVHGSPVLSKTLENGVIYMKTQPYQWYPDNKGGGPQQPVLSDVYMEQWVSFVPSDPRAIKVHYKITHFGTDTHTNTRHELPVVYTNLGYDRLVYYGGTAPWTNGSTAQIMPGNADSPFQYTSENWWARVDNSDNGLTIFVPNQSYVTGRHFVVPDGPPGSAYNSSMPHVPFTFGPNSVLEADYYVFAGDYKQARQSIYSLKPSLSSPDVFTPFVTLDTPQPNAVLSGSVNLGGWALDNSKVNKMEVWVDSTFEGAANYGSARPDVATLWPQAPANIGFNYSLSTAKYNNGTHTITELIASKNDFFQ